MSTWFNSIESEYTYGVWYEKSEYAARIVINSTVVMLQKKYMYGVLIPLRNVPSSESNWTKSYLTAICGLSPPVGIALLIPAEICQILHDILCMNIDHCRQDTTECIGSTINSLNSLIHKCLWHSCQCMGNLSVSSSIILLSSIISDEFRHVGVLVDAALFVFLVILLASYMVFCYTWCLHQKLCIRMGRMAA